MNKKKPKKPKKKARAVAQPEHSGACPCCGGHEFERTVLRFDERWGVYVVDDVYTVST